MEIQMLDEDDQMDEILKEIKRSTDKLFGPERRLAAIAEKEKKKQDKLKKKQAAKRAKKKPKIKKKPKTQVIHYTVCLDCDKKIRKNAKPQLCLICRNKREREKELQIEAEKQRLKEEKQQKQERIKEQISQYRKDHPERLTLIPVKHRRIYDRMINSHFKKGRAGKLLTPAEFVVLLEDFEKCVYCGRSPTGFDRIDSNITYAVGNVKPACKKCNIMKNAMTLEQFLQTIRDILAYTDQNPI